MSIISEVRWCLVGLIGALAVCLSACTLGGSPEVQDKKADVPKNETVQPQKSDSQLQSVKVSDQQKPVSPPKESQGGDQKNPTPPQNPTPAQANAGGSYTAKYFYLNTGVATFAPYKIKTTTDPVTSAKTFNLDTGGTSDVSFFIDALYRRREAWCNDPIRFWGINWDAEAVMGFSNASSDLAAKTLAGSGEFFGQFSFGWPYARGVSPSDAKTQFTSDFEGLLGVVTDKSSLDLHPYYGLGDSVTVSVPFYKDNQDPKNNRDVEILVGLYAGAVSVPDFADSTSTAIKGARDLPRYRQEFAVISRAQLHIPIAPESYVSFDGLFAEDPRVGIRSIHTWSLMIGLTLPLDKVVGLLKLDTGTPAPAAAKPNGN
jgi:hypothetical protein